MNKQVAASKNLPQPNLTPAKAVANAKNTSQRRNNIKLWQIMRKKEIGGENQVIAFMIRHKSF